MANPLEGIVHASIALWNTRLSIFAGQARKKLLHPAPMSLSPPEPVVPDEHRARGPFVLRYDDIGQTGHLLVAALPIALGQTAWAAVNKSIPEDTFRRTRILPILSRFAVEAGAAPFSVTERLDAESVIQFAHTLGSDGQVERLMLNMWCSVHGKAGRTYGFAVPNAGERLFAGRVFAEHVMTRPFDPPETRRVTELDIPGSPRIPNARHEWRAPENLLQLPANAEWIDASFKVDAAPVVFGTDRTDSNLHVNSLVYFRMFTDAILRRLWEHGKRLALRNDALEIAYRKPSFAGDCVHVAVRAFVSGEKLGASVLLINGDEAKGPIELAKPRVFARMSFVPE